VRSSTGAATGSLTAAKARRSSLQSTTSEAGAILVNVLALEEWYLLLGKAVAISCTTGICALLFVGLSRAEFIDLADDRMHRWPDRGLGPLDSIGLLSQTFTSRRCPARSFTAQVRRDSYIVHPWPS
jgi:hypothetical protein